MNPGNNSPRARADSPSLASWDGCLKKSALMQTGIASGFVVIPGLLSDPAIDEATDGQRCQELGRIPS